MYCICLIDVVAGLLFLFYFFQTNEHTRFGKSRALLENMSKYCMNKEDKMHSCCGAVFGSVYFSCPCINCDLLGSSKTSITMLDRNGCEWKSIISPQWYVSNVETNWFLICKRFQFFSTFCLNTKSEGSQDGNLTFQRNNTLAIWQRYNSFSTISKQSCTEVM